MAKQYSKITEITIQNFMSIEHAVIEPGVNGVTIFKGFNCSGKSAVLEALQILLTDHNKTAQKQFIQFGKDYFRITATFSDGVKLVRDKYSNGESLYEMYKDGSCIYSNKNGNRLTPVKTMPDIIQEYISISVFEGKCLGFQDARRELMLIETTPLENYKLLGQAADDGAIYKGLDQLKKELKENSKVISETDMNMRHYAELIKDYSVSSPDVLAYLKELDEDSERHANYLSSLQDFRKSIDSYLAIPVLPEEPCKIINTNYLQDLMGLESAVASYLKVPVLKELPLIKGMSYLQDLMALKSSVEAVIDKKEYPTVPKLDCSLLSNLVELANIISEVIELDTEIKKVDSKIEMLRDEMIRMQDELARKGFRATKCPNCQKIHLVDFSKGKL